MIPMVRAAYTTTIQQFRATKVKLIWLNIHIHNNFLYELLYFRKKHSNLYHSSNFYITSINI